MAAVVPSPEPVRIVELGLIKLLVDSGAIVICAGGGGVPVTEDSDGGLHGIEAVIDKDLTAALLARDTRPDMLLLLTDVPAVVEGYPDEPPAADPAGHRRRAPGPAVRGRIHGT